MRLFLLSIFCILSTARIFGQNYSFLSYSTSEGLPQSQVTSITQDEHGYLWIGTLSGLARFNGKNFVNFSVENGLVNNRITSLSIINKELWIGHEGGISVMKNGTSQGWQLFREDRTVKVTAIIAYKEHIIAATNGGGLYVLRDKKLQKIDLPNEDAYYCRDLSIVNDELYLATRGGIFKTRDLKEYLHVSLYGDRNISGFSKQGNKMTISTFSEVLFSSDSHFKTRDSILLHEPDYNVRGIFTDSKRNTWLNSNLGVIRINTAGKRLFLNEQNGLPIASVNCVFEDREGTIWMGTEGKGLLRFTGEQFVYYNSKNGFPSDLILSAVKQKNGDYLFGSYDKGLFSLDKQGIITAIKTPGTSIWSLEFDNFGNLWSGSELGLYRHDKKGGMSKFVFNDENRKITVIKKYNNSKLIVGGSDGIGWIRDGKFFKINLNTDFAKTIGTVRDFSFYLGKIICASDKGLFEIDPAKASYNRIRYFSSGAKSLAIDNNNRLWIGTESGVFLYDGIRFEGLKIGNSNASRFINFQKKIDKFLYIGTNDGLYVFDADAEKPAIIRHYGINDGLINLESNINSAFYDGHYLWFGTAEGLVRCDVTELADANSTLKPIVNITGILLNYQSFRYSEFSSKLDERGLPVDLTLPYTKNNITIDLDGILLANPDRLRYQFWMEGQDETWSPPISNASIVLSNINYGDYRLHIRTINEMGISSNEILFPIHITPPFWGTWWFYSAIIIFLILGIRMYFRLQIRRERERNYKENLENRTRLLSLEQQSLNASMNRHFIFNSLNSIQYFINTQDRISANRYLTNFAKLIRKNLDSAAEDENMVTLDQELERLELYLSLESMRFKDRFHYIIDSGDIDTEHVVVPAMLLQPFVENSIIHGILPDETKKGEISILLRIVDSVLEITLDDNGIGIDFSMNQKQRSQGDHTSQGMEITSKRIDLIRKMWKKDYELHGPFQVTDSNHTIKGTRVLIKIPVDNLEIPI